jgi:hypothetical protein
MRTYLLIFAVNVFLVLGGCRAAAPEYVPTSTIRDLMISILDPSADVLWGSVATIVTAKGVDRKFPRTDEEWGEVRRHAITLVESTNLLLVPNRHVAKPGQTANNPDFEREPQDIEAQINRDRSTFENHVRGLRDAVMNALAAIESRDVAALEESGDGLDRACEACHETYWYRTE